MTVIGGPLVHSQGSVDALLAEIRVLERLVAERRADHDALTGKIAAFRRRYLRTVGARYTKLDELRAEIASLEAKLSPSPEASAAAFQATAQAAESRSAFDEVQRDDRPNDFKPTKNLKSLYRKVMRAVHPDTAGPEDDESWRHEFAVEANQAFQDADEARLQELLDAAGERGAQAAKLPMAERIARLKRRMARAETALIDLAEQIQQLKKDKLYQLMWQWERVQEQGRDLLAEMCMKLDERVQQESERLAQLRAREDGDESQR